MPLNVFALTDSLRAFMDEDFAGFTGWPDDELDAADKWATAIDSYAGINVIPVVNPLSILGARAAMQIALSGMSAPGAGPLLFEIAFSAYAASLAGGMAPDFIATPPPPGLSVAMSLAGLSAVATPLDTASQLAIQAAVIDTWFRTGTATPAGGGPAVPWS